MFLSIFLITIFSWGSVMASKRPDIVAWEEYVQFAQCQTELQSNCIPRRFPASEPRRGTIILFHGFSACPQQYFRLAPIIASNGFDVLLPLTPGHGASLDLQHNDGFCVPGLCNGTLDEVSELPTEVEDYIEFVDRINAIANISEGLVAVGGLSLGGALASAAGQARRADGSALYGRQIVLSPLLQVAYERLDRLVDVLNGNPLTRNIYVGWGDGCRTERSLGRAGICTFRVSQMAAARDFGAQILAQLNLPVVGTPAQVSVVYDRADPVVATSAVRELASKYANQSSNALAPLVLPFTCHSFLSPWDDVGVSKWWMGELYCAIADFLTEGKPIPASAAIEPSEGGNHLVELNCSESLCPYNATDVYSCPYTPPAAFS